MKMLLPGIKKIIDRDSIQKLKLMIHGEYMVKSKITLLVYFFFTAALYPQADDSLSIASQGTEPVKVIIARPVTKYGNAPLKDKWLLLLCENHLNFRLKGIESISVVPSDALSNLLKDYEEYKIPVSLDNYTKAAKKLSVPYVVYLQCEYYKFASEMQVNLGDDINFFGKLISIDTDSSLLVDALQFPLKKLGFQLDTFISNVLQKLAVKINDKNRKFLETAIMCYDDKEVKKLGQLLAAVNGPEKIQWGKFYEKYNKMLKSKPEMLVGYYAGVKVCESAKKYEEGAGFARQLIDMLDVNYPPNYIDAARLYRLSGDYKEALRMLESAPKSVLINNDVEKEMGLLYEKMGK